MKYWLLAPLIAIAACTTITPEEQAELDRSLAILRGESSEFSSVFNSVKPVYEASFSSLNGDNIQALGGYISKRELKIQPGEHSLVVNCKWSRGDVKLSSAERITRQFEAGIVYKFKPRLEKGGKCVLDMSTETI